ncbi:META domain-containing protein [Polymorphum gilvum]|uniref:Probable secreted protein containing HslJ-like protein n=1 Tax=Polymorphum gilvum (strain LMG 25793 / CGMCC 1.9160 / SL003B-26A1) TaxID=991905 RepID=F2IXB7_POLGS|nr:META domain-containing protein [Polymorphum gilvum]ADZ70435.1 Probable secreted protein containing HslJ-like protein [Polymorphum gilvum SL003B-26A1]
MIRARIAAWFRPPFLGLAAGLSLTLAAGAGHAQDLPFDLAGNWQVEEIDGTPVLDGVDVQLDLSSGGTAGGSTGCNTMFGQVKVSGGVLKIGPLAVTRKACPPAVMEQERKLLEVIGAVADYRKEDGALVLLSAAGGAVMRLSLRP